MKYCLFLLILAGTLPFTASIFSSTLSENIINACIEGDKKVITKWVESGADINATDKFNNTALYLWQPLKTTV